MHKTISIALLFMAVFITRCSNSTQPSEPPATIKKADAPAGAAHRKAAVKTILFFGNSLTAGYGLNDPAEAFPALIQQKIDSLQLPYNVVNAGVSGETSSGGNSRIDWVLRQPVNIFVLELGANDGLRGIPIDETRKNLQAIIDKVVKKYPQAKIVLAGMQIPPNMGRQYATDFRGVFPALASKNKAVLIPFLLQGVGGEARLNQQDGIHPTAEGHRIVAGNVWSRLQPLLAE
jgi:acyl-CoA thioesterase-1